MRKKKKKIKERSFSFGPEELVLKPNTSSHFFPGANRSEKIYWFFVLSTTAIIVWQLNNVFSKLARNNVDTIFNKNYFPDTRDANHGLDDSIFVFLVWFIIQLMTDIAGLAFQQKVKPILNLHQGNQNSELNALLSPCKLNLDVYPAKYSRLLIAPRFIKYFFTNYIFKPTVHTIPLAFYWTIILIIRNFTFANLGSEAKLGFIADGMKVLMTLYAYGHFSNIANDWNTEWTNINPLTIYSSNLPRIKKWNESKNEFTLDGEELKEFRSDNEFNV